MSEERKVLTLSLATKEQNQASILVRAPYHGFYIYIYIQNASRSSAIPIWLVENETVIICFKLYEQLYIPPSFDAYIWH